MITLRATLSGVAASNILVHLKRTGTGTGTGTATRKFAYAHANLHTHTQIAYAHANLHTHTQICIRTCTCKRAFAHAHSHMHMRTCTFAHAHSHMHTCAFAHIQFTQPPCPCATVRADLLVITTDDDGAVRGDGRRRVHLAARFETPQQVPGVAVNGIHVAVSGPKVHRVVDADGWCRRNGRVGGRAERPRQRTTQRW